MKTGKIHRRRLDTSEKLQRVYRLLLKNSRLSTLEIQERAQVCCVSTMIAELRANGLRIDCKPDDGIYYYSLAGVL